MNKLALSSMKIGDILIFVGKLQIFWFAIFFRYIIFAGLYPATAAVIHFLFKSFEDSTIMHKMNFHDFLAIAKDNFKRANQVGYLSGLILFFLFADLRLAFVFAHNIYVTVCLAALMTIFAGSFLYLIPVIVRYNLTLLNAFRQAFFLLLANLVNTLAMLIGMTIALIIGFFIPVLVLIPVPLFLLANAWFSYLAMTKLEKANMKK